MKTFDRPPPELEFTCSLQATLPTAGLNFVVFGANPTWRTDGTAAGTYVLAEDCLGSCEFERGKDVAILGDTAYFIRQGQDGTILLRKTDGTPEGTGISMVMPPGTQADRYPPLVAFKNRLLILTYRHILLSDGSLAGTQVLGTVEGGYTIGAPAVVGSRAIFWAAQETHGIEPWVTDGTPEGTHRLLEICPGDCGSEPGHTVVRAGNLLYFLVRNNVQTWVWDLWRSDGTEAGTFRLHGAFQSEGLSAPYAVRPLGSKVLFCTYGSEAGQLWVSDGTSEGTVKLGDFAQFPSWEEDQRSLIAGSPTRTGPALLFVADDRVHGSELWSTDGTAGGTRLVREFTPGAGGSMVSFLGSYGGGVLLHVEDLQGRVQLWRSDGTPEGTSMVGQIDPVGQFSQRGETTITGRKAIFGAQTGAGDQSLGQELWSTDLVTGETVLLGDICTGQCSALTTTELLVVGSVAVFSARTADYTCRLWRTDGTPDGTYPLDEWPRYPHRSGSWGLDGMTNVNGRLVFAATSVGGNTSLWRSDGTTAGTVPLGVTDRLNYPTASGGQLFGLTTSTFTRPSTVLVADPDSGEVRYLEGCRPSLAIASPNELVPFRGGVLLQGFDTDHGNELWASDGTCAGTAMVADIRPGTEGSTPRGFGPLGSADLFSADTGGRARDLWRTDGTVEGTSLVSAELGPLEAVRVDDRVFFKSCSPPGPVCQLMVSDGTREGTRLLPANNPGEKVAFQGGLVWLQPLSQGTQLWRSDGTAEGTVAFDFLPLRYSSAAAYGITTAGSHAFLGAASQPGDVELWWTDGTAAGTGVVKDIAPGPLASNPRGFVAADELVLFAASDGPHGRELWRSDGTENGTDMVADLCPGACSSGPYGLTRVGSTIFFAADDWQHDMALWAIDTGLVEVSVMDAVVFVGGDKAMVGLELSRRPERQVIVSFETEDGTAHAGEDYLHSSGTVTIPTGSETARPIAVPVRARGAGDPKKWFLVHLNEQSGGTVRRSTARVTLSGEINSHRARQHLPRS